MKITSVPASLFLTSIFFFILPADALAQSKSMGNQPLEIEIDGEVVSALLSPNEGLIVWTTSANWNDREIMLANADGTNFKQLTDSRMANYEPVWGPDGERIVFTSERSGKCQIYSMSDSGQDLKQLTDSAGGASGPKFSSQGHFAWQVTHAGNEKIYPSDIMIRLVDSEEEKTLVEKTRYPGYSWDADGQTLAVGCIGSLEFINVETDDRKTVLFQEIDQRLNSHSARKIQWSEDGQQVACRVEFVGGSVGNGEVFGDKEVFLIGRDGTADIFENLTSAKESHDWITIK